MTPAHSGAIAQGHTRLPIEAPPARPCSWPDGTPGSPSLDAGAPTQTTRCVPLPPHQGSYNAIEISEDNAVRNAPPRAPELHWPVNAAIGQSKWKRLRVGRRSREGEEVQEQPVTLGLRNVKKEGEGRRSKGNGELDRLLFPNHSLPSCRAPRQTHQPLSIWLSLVLPTPRTSGNPRLARAPVGGNLSESSPIGGVLHLSQAFFLSPLHVIRTFRLVTALLGGWRFPMLCSHLDQTGNPAHFS